MRRVHTAEWQATEIELEELRFKLHEGAITRREYEPRARAILDRQDNLIWDNQVWRNA